MYFSDRGCVRPSRHLYGYATACRRHVRVLGCCKLLKVTLDVPLPRNMKYSRGTELFIQWRDADSRQVYGLSFATADAADGFQQWLDYATNPSTTAPPPAPAQSTSSVSSSTSAAGAGGESHYQRPRPHAAASNGPDVDSQHQLVFRMSDERVRLECKHTDGRKDRRTDTSDCYTFPANAVGNNNVVRGHWEVSKPGMMRLTGDNWLPSVFRLSTSPVHDQA